MILTVSSARPTARKRLLCSPAGTRPSAMHTTSDDISLRSVYSFSWPVCQHRTTTATDLHKKAASGQMWKQKIEWYICLETTRTNRKSPIYHTKNAIHDYKASTEHMQKEFSKKLIFLKQNWEHTVGKNTDIFLYYCHFHVVNALDFSVNLWWWTMRGREQG